MEPSVTEESVVVTPPEPNEGSQMKTMKRVLLVVAPILLLAVGSVSLLLYSPASDARSAVSWAVPSLYQSLAAGKSTTTSVTFTAAVQARDVVVQVAPAIAPYVSVSPSKFPSIARGGKYPITVTYSAPADAAVGVVNGAITLLQGRVALADALGVGVEVVSSLTPKERIAALEDQGALPKLDRSSDVQGPDVNANGIRDDVETYIATNYTSTPQRAAAEQFARVIQSAMLVDNTDAAAAKAIALRGSRAVNCIYSHFDGNAGSKQPAAVVEELKSVSTNTKARLLAYLAYSKALDGTTGALPEGDTCE